MAGDLGEEQRRVRLSPAIPIAVMHLLLLGIEGRWEEVRALAAAATPGQRDASRSIPRTVLGQVAFAQGEHDLVLDLVREVLPEGPVTEPGGSSFLMAMALQRLAAAVAVDAGDRETARAWLEAHDRWLAGSGAVLGPGGRRTRLGDLPSRRRGARGCPYARTPGPQLRHRAAPAARAARRPSSPRRTRYRLPVGMRTPRGISMPRSPSLMPAPPLTSAR